MVFKVPTDKKYIPQVPTHSASKAGDYLFRLVHRACKEVLEEDETEAPLNGEEEPKRVRMHPAGQILHIQPKFLRLIGCYWLMLVGCVWLVGLALNWPTVPVENGSVKAGGRSPELQETAPKAEDGEVQMQAEEKG